MIPKGNQRGGGKQLATHLLNEFDNERVELVEIRGAVAPDLHGAFAEWRAQAGATRCRKYLYSLSVNPDHRQGPFSRDQYYDFIERTEQSLGLSNQPRAVVIHVKKGREHYHVVWSRIDLEKMKAVHMAHDHQKLRTVAQEYARDHGIELPKGMQKERGKERFKDRARAETYGERQQYERTGITKQERMRDVRAAWDQSDNAVTFVRALEERGYLLARGDGRDYVVVDRGGEIYSLTRQLAGIKPKDVKARLAEYPAERLPDAHTAQKFIRERLEREPTKEPAGPTPQERRAALKAAHAKRREPLNRLRDETRARQNHERETLLAAQRAENVGIVDERLRQQPKGLLAFVARITGFKAFTEFRHRRQDQERAAVHQRQQDALERRHARERHEIRRRYRALKLVLARERHSLETRLRREGFRDRPVERERDRGDDSGRTDRGGGGGAAPQPGPVILPASVRQPDTSMKGRLARLFRRQTGQTKVEAKENAIDATKPRENAPLPSLESAERTEPGKEAQPSEARDPSHTPLRQNADDITRAPASSIDPDEALAAALRERAERKSKQQQRMKADEPQISATDAFTEALRQRAERKRAQQERDASRTRPGRGRDRDRDR